MNEPASWQVTAVNLAEHARNPIHTDAGGRAAGFDVALVAGVTTYIYLTHPAAEAWGMDWLRSGGAEVRFRSPVLDGDSVECVPTPGEDPGSVTIEAVARGEARATCTFTRIVTGPVGPRRAGELLPSKSVTLDDRWADYGSRAGDNAGIYADEGIVHPAVWPALANDVVHSNLVEGAWIHTRSVIRHLDVAPVGSVAEIESVVVDRFDTRTGTRAVLDVLITVAGTLVATLEHEAIISVR